MEIEKMRTHKKIRLFTLFSISVVVMVILVACLASTAQVPPAIRLDPTGGGPGTLIVVTGTGFPPELELSMRLGPPNVGATPRSYARAIADADGEFSATLAMPGKWPDGRPIIERDLVVVVINEDGSVKATAPFDFQPSGAAQPDLSLKPANGAPGQQIMVVGHDFPAGARIALRLGVPNTGLSGASLVEVQADDLGTFELALTIPTAWPGSGVPIIEQELVIAAVDESIGQALATAPFSNLEGGDAHPPGAELPPGPRLVVQRPDGSIQYVSLDGSSAVLVAAAPASLLPAGFDHLPMTDGPMVYLRQWAGGLYVLDTPVGRLIPLDFVPSPASPLAVRPVTDGLLPEGQPISLAWSEFSATHTASARLYLAAPDGSQRAEVLEEVYDTSDPWARFVPWRWGQNGRLFFTKEPIDGMGGFPPFVNAANLWVFSPQDGSSQELVSADVTRGALCLDAIAPDDRRVAHHCDEGQITLLDLVTGDAAAVRLPDQTVSDTLLGSVRFSLEGSRIAFAVMTGGLGLIEKTRGYVAVSDGLGGGSHIVAASEPGEWFSVAAWLPGDRWINRQRIRFL
jgi:hypothetical protein